MNPAHYFSPIVAFDSLKKSFFSEMKKPDAPKAEKKHHIEQTHGETRPDPYFWLREKENPDVIAYLKAENAYTDAVMSETSALQDTLYHELVGRIKETDMEVPVKRDDYFYYSRTEKGKQYTIFCRKQGSLQGRETILLDLNILAEHHDYFQTGILSVSPNHRYLAHSTDTTGDEVYTLRIKDLEKGQTLPEEIHPIRYSFAWANDSRTCFYCKLDRSKRPYQLWKHRLGTPVAEDELVFTENDEMFFLYVFRSKSKRYIFLEIESKTSSEVWFVPADKPDDEFSIITPREKGHEYNVDHRGDSFYILTNSNAQNFRLAVTSTEAPSREHWQELIPHRPEVKLDAFDLFRDHLIVYERVNGLEQIRIHDFPKNQTHYIDFHEQVYSLQTDANPEFETETFRFRYSSLLTPLTVFDYNLNTRQKILRKQKEVLGNFRSGNYRSERIYATAADGTKIPISLAYRKGTKRTPDTPLFLYGYGAYGISMDPAFSSYRFSLIDRGFIYAIAHIRGGGEMGRPWYEAGKVLNKMTTFNDFVTCAEHLIANRYTSPDKLVISGGSAGGLLVGTVINMRPDLFRAVVAKVPFVDVLNTMLDETIPLTVAEYDEWGNPNEKTYYDYIKSYSPYDNVAAQSYPHMLVTAGLNDPRVHYWEPAKWTAKLRENKKDNRILILKTNMGAGHGGASGRYDYLREVAFDYAFILHVLDK